MATIDEDATRVVMEMRAAGALFQVHTGALDSETWVYSVSPEQRQECRRIMRSVDLTRIGFNAAFCAAIRASGCRNIGDNQGTRSSLPL